MTRLTRPPDTTPALYEQDGMGRDAVVHAHYFVGSSDWWITEYDPGKDLAFGFARVGGDDLNAELGYTRLADLDTLRSPAAIHMHGTVRQAEFPVEYDEGWTPRPLREALAAAGVDR